MMTSIIKKISILALVISMSALAGCAAISGNGGADGAVVGDLLTERSVIRAIYDQPDLAGEPIQVGCVDGVITLTGQVTSDIERQLAERVTLGVDGVTSVNNNLQTRS